MSSSIVRAAVVLGVLALPALAMADTPASTVLGGKLYWAGGEVKVTVLPAEAGYTSELGIYTAPNKATRKAVLATNRQQGLVKVIPAAQLTSWGFKTGDELVFGIFVTNTSHTYFMGDGPRNPDGIAHANLTVTAPNVATVGFEDLYGGGDRDFDDNVFGFAGGIAPTPPPPPPPPNTPPNCAAAQPSVLELWPPNHKMVPVNILGCTDKENDAFTIRVLRIRQDEPVIGTGSGNTAPDGIIKGSSVELRAERSGQGDTRVYNITFVATDAKGAASPETTISVAVTKAQGQETHPKGPSTYDSTEVPPAAPRGNAPTR